MTTWNLSTTRRGLLIVLSAPSGGGKSTLAKAMRAADPLLEYSISYTTRPLRPNEVDGRHYHFVTEEKFQELIDNGDLCEWARVHGHLYGTSRTTLEKATAEGRDILMDLDVQGGINLKQQRPDAVLIFLLPPSLDTLRNRLESRATDSREEIDRRLSIARVEIGHWRDYDYAVMNDDLDLTVARARGIVEAERHRPLRMTISWKD